MKKKSSITVKKSKDASFTLATCAINDYASNGGGGNLYKRIAAAANFSQKMQDFKNNWVFANNETNAKYWVFVNNGNDFVNGVDAFYFAGHGTGNGPFLGTKPDYTGPVGFEMKCPNYIWSGDKLKWMMLDCCLCLNDGTSTNTNPNWSNTIGLGRWDRAFNSLQGSLHGIFALRSIGWDVDGTGRHFVENIYSRNYCNGYAWIDAVDWEQYFGGITSQGVVPAVLTACQNNVDWYNESMKNPWVNPGACDPKSLTYSYTWLWKGNPIFKLLKANKMKMFELKNNGLVVLKQVCKALNIKGTAKSTKESSTIKNTNYTITVNNSTGLVYIDKNLNENQPLPVTFPQGKLKQKETKITLPNNKKAREIAANFINDLRFTGDGTPVFSSIEKLMRSVQNTKKNNAIELRVIFTRSIEGSPVFGSGSKIVVRIGNKGQLIGCAVDWPAVSESKKNTKTRTKEDVTQDLPSLIELINNKMFPVNPISSFLVEKTKMVHYGFAKPNGSREIVPAYILSINGKRTNGETIKMDLPVSAVENIGLLVN